MKSVDRKKFFDGYRAAIGHLTQRQVNGLESLLASLEMDDQVTDPRWAAYMLATTRHETADTFCPISEFGRGAGRPYGEADPETGRTYYGRGYVQLTWKDNYRQMGEVFNIDLVNDPDAALLPSLAYRIMSYGMRHGSFTGVGLARYINAETCDYRNARRIINGTDCALRIAGMAEKFQAILEGAQ
jgi:hypothetical protein